MPRKERTFEEKTEVWNWADETFNGIDEETGMVGYNPYSISCEDPECEECAFVEAEYDEFCEWLYEELFGACDRLHAECNHVH